MSQQQKYMHIMEIKLNRSENLSSDIAFINFDHYSIFFNCKQKLSAHCYKIILHSN